MALGRKNVFILLQTLPNQVVLNNDKAFEDIRVYYDLLLLSPKELLSYFKRLSDPEKRRFSKDQYLLLASSLCTWHDDAQNRDGRTDQVAIEQLRASAANLLE